MREGREVREISTVGRPRGARPRATRGAVAEGVDVIYQGVLIDGRWRGIADFLERTDDGSYEALDTKLAHRAKPAYILQLCFYSEALGRLQGKEPELMHVLLGSGERESFRPGTSTPTRGACGGASRSLSRTRRRRSRSHAGTARSATTCRCARPGGTRLTTSPASHVSVAISLRASCRPASTRCARSRAPTRQIRPPGMNPETFARLQRQAALQLVRREDGQLKWLLEPLEPERGFALLPAPSPGDLFFDIEGYPFWDRQGSLEYLWGFVDGDRHYTALSASDRDSERAAFEELVDRIHARLDEYPDMHVYHYAAYEVSVLRRLAGRYETREHEVDELLRRRVMVDLLKVVRGGLTASVPRYGLKEMEAFLDFERSAEIRDGGSSVVEYERYTQTRDPAILEEIAHYNRGGLRRHARAARLAA